MNKDYISFFKELLSVYWLRPEVALWRSIDIKAMRDFSFVSPSLDIGCGDGIFSFIRGGGRFDITFDAFQSLKKLNRFFDKVDIFDSFNEEVRPIIIKEPDYSIDYGFDHKRNLLRKAETLGLYKKLVLGDANDPFPFKDNYFRSVFSNIIYWLNDVEKVFKEIERVLQPAGRCCVMLPDSCFIENSFYYKLYLKKNNLDFKFLEKLDRGRIKDNLKHAKNSKEWIKIIKKAGLKIVDHKMHLSKTVIQIWDIGLRPIFPLLYKMTQHIEKEEVIRIKKEWIDVFFMFLKHIFLLEEKFNRKQKPAFHCFILTK